MGKLRRKSSDLENANKRMSSVKSIDPNFDLGNGVTQVAYQKLIDAVNSSLDTYNTKLGEADDALDSVTSAEKDLRDMSQRVLSGVGSKYGYDSSEYEQAGGTRKSEKKRPIRKAKAA